jgi:hypothetical protein
MEHLALCGQVQKETQLPERVNFSLYAMWQNLLASTNRVNMCKVESVSLCIRLSETHLYPS